jgi:four helix bundle protein
LSDSALTRFAHQRLDVYHIAQEVVRDTEMLLRRLPRGYAELRDQARRSALATVRHIAEGAGRTSAPDKRARFTVARGEVAELEATLETAELLQLVDPQSIREVRRLTDRVGAMLQGLIRRESYPVRNHPGSRASPF